MRNCTKSHLSALCPPNLQSSAEGQADVAATQLSPQVSRRPGFSESQFSHPENGGRVMILMAILATRTFGPQLSLDDRWYSKDKVPGHTMEAQDTQKR